jgi:hypothetical protein
MPKGTCWVILADTQASLNTSYLWVYIVLGAISIVGGGGGLVAFIKWLKNQTLRDGKIDDMLDPKTGAMALLAQHGMVLADLQRSMRPNGLNTDQLGDIAKRTEHAVDRLEENFNQHKGESDAVHKQLRKDIDRKQDREKP